jgi:hypothetical protein
VSRIADRDCDALLELRDRLGELLYDRVHQVTDDRLVATFVTSGVLMCVWRRPSDFDANVLVASMLSMAEQRARQWLASSTAPLTIVDSRRPWTVEGAGNEGNP